MKAEAKITTSMYGYKTPVIAIPCKNQYDLSGVAFWEQIANTHRAAAQVAEAFGRGELNPRLYAFTVDEEKFAVKLEPCARANDKTDRETLVVLKAIAASL
jgi:hypothetical protein